MPCDHAYYRWYHSVTQKYVDHNSAKLDIMIESHLVLLVMLAEGSPKHNHVWCILNSVAGLGGGPVANGQANNGHETKSVVSATLNTSAIPLSTLSCGRHATASPSPSAARGCGQRAIANLSTSATRGHGWCATTP